jgi:hypothetical protein
LAVRGRLDKESIVRRAVHQLFLSDPRGDVAFLNGISQWLAETDAEDAGASLVGDPTWQVHDEVVQVDPDTAPRFMLVVTYEAEPV